MLRQVLSYTFYGYLLSLTEMLSLWLVYFWRVRADLFDPYVSDYYLYITHEDLRKPI